MIRPRVIPVLLLKKSGLYKTKNFSNPQYVGDPINAIRIFNEKEVDELVLLDITASIDNAEPDLGVLRDIVSECYMPLSFGGGIRNNDMIREILKIGVEKVIINTAAIENPSLIMDAAKQFGSSTIIISVDVKKNLFNNYHVYKRGGREKTNLNLIDWVKECERLGAGEILINSIDQDGTTGGYDWKLIKGVSDSVSIPVIATGGASSIEDFKRAIKECNASAVAAGSFFVFQGKHRAVLISYPTKKELSPIYF